MRRSSKRNCVTERAQRVNGCSARRANAPASRYRRLSQEKQASSGEKRHQSSSTSLLNGPDKNLLLVQTRDPSTPSCASNCLCPHLGSLSHLSPPCQSRIESLPPHHKRTLISRILL
ncbi:hypothetical protein Ddc_10072 [Ditylenchus destructor]|nr:hypothetical protein Ddc_10072 [Ditylenchus destructor]